MADTGYDEGLHDLVRSIKELSAEDKLTVARDLARAAPTKTKTYIAANIASRASLELSRRAEGMEDD